MTTTHLLYLHGFRSSPFGQSPAIWPMWRSTTRPSPSGARSCRPRPRPRWRWWRGALHPWPRAPWRSSALRWAVLCQLGLAQHAGCPSVMLNPAVDLARDLARYIGEQTSWHDPAERFTFARIHRRAAGAGCAGRPPLRPSWPSSPKATKCWTGARWWPATPGRAAFARRRRPCPERLHRAPGAHHALSCSWPDGGYCAPAALATQTPLAWRACQRAKSSG